MLKEIRCDKFIENGEIRPPIVFNAGLNTLIGSKSGSNSIGKSTFLMILDFVFGGDDYILKSVDTQMNVGVHIIEFKFIFNNEPFYFSRSTGDYTLVNICNEDYKVIQPVSNDKYMALLSEKYGLSLPGLTLRGAVARFFRVYGRETLDEKHPLKQATQESEKGGIKGLIKLCDKYSTIEEQEKLTTIAKDEESTFKKAQKYKFVQAVTTQKAYKENDKRIIELEEESTELARKSNQGLLDMDSIKAQKLADLRHQLSSFKRQRTRLEMQRKTSQADHEYSKHSIQKNYEALIEFFPEVNIEHLENIEHFHKTLTNVLKKELKESSVSLQAMIDLVSSQITAIESEISKINDIPNVSQAILDRYATVKKELQILIDSNSNYVKTSELHDRYKRLQASLDALVIEVIANTQEEINSIMKTLNDTIYEGKKTAPTLTITDADHYNFFTPNDSGTGSQYKGLIVFDIAALQMTNLPVLVHDSILLKQIEDKALEKILEIYSESNKQIFISLDKEGSYTKNAQELMHKTEILRLSPNGGELFGRAWNETN